MKYIVAVFFIQIYPYLTDTQGCWMPGGKRYVVYRSIDNHFENSAYGVLNVQVHVVLKSRLCSSICLAEIVKALANKEHYQFLCQNYWTRTRENNKTINDYKDTSLDARMALLKSGHSPIQTLFCSGKTKFAHFHKFLIYLVLTLLVKKVKAQMRAYNVSLFTWK